MPRRAHTPPDTPPPAQPAGAAAIDLVAGDPPVPITVWRTPSGDGQASVPFRLAERLVSAYSRPGEVVIDVTGDHALSDAAAHGGRRHHPGWFTDASTLIIGPPTPPAAHTRDEHPVSPPVRRRRRGEVDPPEITAWFGDDLTDAHLPPAGGTVHAAADTVYGATSLLVTCWPLHAAGARHRTRLRSLLRGGVALLRTGGCLVLIVRAPAEAPASPQDFGPLVDAARDAGLGYLQHIVAVRADVDGDQFTYYATDAELQALASSGQLPVAHVPVHANLLVFTPRQTGSSTGGARG
jgi:hypothetical protein